MMQFEKITACLDMAGCPNRCRHCWLGNTPNGCLTTDDLQFVAQAFRPFATSIEVASWYREPDYLPEYKELWALENELSTSRQVFHYELMSIWRAVRDDSYFPWLKSLGVEKMQLTLFGGKENTDYYTGRKHAYDEIVKAVELLKDAEITPRIQVFVNQDNITDLQAVVDLIHKYDITEAFVHQGSCDGENIKLYDRRVTPADLGIIPQELVDLSLCHYNANSLTDIFGKTEKELVEELSDSTETKSYVSETPVFFVDKDFNIYPNITTPAPHWKLGNLKSDGAEAVLSCYCNSESPAQKARLTIPIGKMVRRHGNPDSLRLFVKSDYYDPIIKSWCEEGAK